MRYLHLLSGGPDGLAYAVMNVLEGHQVHVLHCVPSNGTRHVRAQVNLLERLGSGLEWVRIDWTPEAYFKHRMLDYLGPLMKAAEHCSPDMIITGMIEEDDPDEDAPFQEVVDLLSPYPLDVYRPVPKTVVGDFLGPITEITISCNTKHCNGCYKCQNRHRTLKWPHTNLNRDIQSLYDDFVTWQQKDVFMAARETIYNGLYLNQ